MPEEVRLAPTRPSEQTTDLHLHERLAAVLGSGTINALMNSCSYRREGVENYDQFWRVGKPVVFTLWHGRLLPCTHYHRQQGVVTLISHHRDGEYITRIVRRWGYTAVRGSTSRGGLEALRELIQHLKHGRSLAITPDGPRGPREKMKPGPVLMAQRSGAPIIPVVSGASRAWYFGGWDRFMIPQPFARLQIAYGEPIFVPRRAGEAEIQAIADRVEEVLGELKRRVDTPWER
ncbi:MAG TPA: lysophospholipid acyltransferase family protein [Longimicrobiaceae bacterium]|nr:lysophospholipid acyltransferase family protein [Longimicrobiaceae bacterium]